MRRPAHRLHRPATRTTTQPGSIPAMPHGRAIVPSPAGWDRCRPGPCEAERQVQPVQGSGPAAPPAPIAAARMPLAGPGRHRQARESKGGVRSGVCARSMASRSCPERFELGAPGMPLSAPRRSRSRRHRCTRDTRTSHPGRGVGYGIGQSRRMTGKGLPAPRSAAATVDDPRLHKGIVGRAREAKHFREGGNLDRPAIHVL